MKSSVNQNTNISAAAAVLIIFLLAATSFVYYYFFTPMFDNSSVQTRIVSIPEIKTHIRNDDGEPYAVDASIAFEFTEYVPNVNRDQLMLLAQEAIESLDYDRLMQPGAVSYVQDAIRGNISKYVSDEDITGVYISELQSGDIRIALPPPTESAAPIPNDRNRVANKLFGGMK